MKKRDITVVICCAGMGTRLGIGSTKALINVCGKPLIYHQLSLLDDMDDVRIVVGYQAEQLIQTVNLYRRDILFAFNYDFEKTGAAASFSKGLLRARKYVVYLDGDLLINKQDFQALLEKDGECLAVSNLEGDEVIPIDFKNGSVIAFSKDGKYRWPGLAKLKSDKVKMRSDFVYEMIRPCLPLPGIKIRCAEINTPADYEKAVEWVEDGNEDAP